MKKLVMIGIAVILIVFNCTAPAAAKSAVSLENVTYAMWEENLSESNRIIDTFFSNIENDQGNISLPAYYAGFEITNEGTLIVHLTNIEPDTIATVEALCESSNLVVEFARYSFEDLDSTLMCFDKETMDMYHIKIAMISIPDNCINLFVTDASALLCEAQNSLQNILPVNCTKVRSYVSAVEAALTSAFPEGYISPQTRYGYFDEKKDYNIREMFKDITLKYGAQGKCNNQYGTVGYLALDTSGNKILITHGHNLASAAYYYNGTNVGTATVLGTNDTLDAAVVILNSSTTITNNSYWNNASFTSTVNSNANIASVSGNTGYFRGYTSGAEKSGVIAYAYDETGNYYFYLTNGSLSIAGDSGAPVYTKPSSSNYKLLGIIKGNDSGGVKFISVPNIKGAYSHYVYLNSNSYT